MSDFSYKLRRHTKTDDIQPAISLQT